MGHLECRPFDTHGERVRDGGVLDGVHANVILREYYVTTVHERTRADASAPSPDVARGEFQ
jgi:hypothetical protein